MATSNCTIYQCTYNTGIKTVEVYNCVHQQHYSRSESGHHKCQVHVLKPCNNESNNVACALHSISYHGNIVNLNNTKCPTKKTKSIASTHYKYKGILHSTTHKYVYANDNNYIIPYMEKRIVRARNHDYMTQKRQL